ncbi:MAG: hypothetical protein QOE23_1027 [Pseudonocardiales bacterium]|jgi:hypothetical protein|nr:hypothetical protein [Pseudonocardiales bacterium]
MNDRQHGGNPALRTRVVDMTSNHVSVSQPVLAEPDTDLVIGREGDVALGVVPADFGVSRRALTVRATAKGWSIEPTNSNGIVLQPWGQAPSWLDIGRPVEISWPWVGLRIIGSRSDVQHWVLLEAGTGSTRSLGTTSTQTESPDPKPLTKAQSAAIAAVFPQHLSWPPVAGPVPHTLDAAARRLGVSTAAVYQRLEAARARAYLLGSHPQASVTEPDYVYVLVRNGFIQFPQAEVVRG